MTTLYAWLTSLDGPDPPPLHSPHLRMEMAKYEGGDRTGVQTDNPDSTANGEEFGKSAGNAVWLEERHTSSSDI
jgi:hypothetical protein